MITVTVLNSKKPKPSIREWGQRSGHRASVMVEDADGENDQGGQIPVPVKGVAPPARGLFLGFIL